jgi:hypothetical protein
MFAASLTPLFPPDMIGLAVQMVIPHPYVDGILRQVRRHSVGLLIFNKSEECKEAATGFFAESKYGPALFTARHVLERYREHGDLARLQIGEHARVIKNILPSDIYLHRHVDIGMLRLSRAFIELNGWEVLPLDQVSLSGAELHEQVAFAGFIGSTKEFLPGRRMSIVQYGVVGLVSTVQPADFSIRMDEESQSDHAADEKMFELGGLSGAAVFKVSDAYGNSLPSALLTGLIHTGHAWDRLNQIYKAVHIQSISEWFG